jgi:hypothetical protein
MQPVVQRHLARLRTRRLALCNNRFLLRRAPTSPSWRPGRNLHASETVPINWQITWHIISLARSNRQNSSAQGAVFGRKWDQTKNRRQDTENILPPLRPHSRDAPNRLGSPLKGRGCLTNRQRHSLLTASGTIR